MEGCCTRPHATKENHEPVVVILHAIDPESHYSQQELLAASAGLLRIVDAALPAERTIRSLADRGFVPVLQTSEMRDFHAALDTLPWRAVTAFVSQPLEQYLHSTDTHRILGKFAELVSPAAVSVGPLATQTMVAPSAALERAHTLLRSATSETGNLSRFMSTFGEPPYTDMSVIPRHPFDVVLPKVGGPRLLVQFLQQPHSLALRGTNASVDYLKNRSDRVLYTSEQRSYIERRALPHEIPSVNITHWLGRLGNQLVQLANAILVAKSRGISWLTYPPNCNVPLPRNGINLNFPKSATSNLFIMNSFFMFTPIQGIDKQAQAEVLQQFILPYVPFTPDPSISSQTLVMHVRSGDMFIQNPMGVMVPTPLSFYTKVIKESNWSEVVVVTEPDRANPVVGQLQSLFPKLVRVQTNRLFDDVSTILSATNLATGLGTFSEYVPLLSKRLRTWHWCRCWQEWDLWSAFTPNRLAFDVFVYEPQHYMNGWTNSKEDRARLLGLPESAVVLSKHIVRRVPLTERLTQLLSQQWS